MLIPLLAAAPEIQGILDFPLVVSDGGYGLTPDDALIRTDMDNGIQRLRRRNTVSLDTIKVKWLLTAWQMQYFRTWYVAELNHGCKWFALLVPSAFETDPCNITAKQCRFVAPWSAVKQNRYWEVSADLKMVSADNARVNATGVLEPLPAVNAWDDQRKWVE